MLLLCNMAGEVVSVLVALAVPEVFHEWGHRVPKMERYRQIAAGVYLCNRRLVGLAGRVAFRGAGEVEGSLGEGEEGLGHTDEVRRLLGGDRHGECLRVGEAHIFRGENHQATSD